MDDSGAGRFVDKNKAREKRGGLGRVANPHQEELDAMRRHAQDQCKPQVEQYVSCTRDKTLSGIWLCRDFLREMEECLVKYENKFELAKRVKAKNDAAAMPR
eukprot:TRINITY_DN29289_c0_g1_i2.p2 TRINITY_DN29289_c0_g1~~TRINITY_DN29289_c0_g1_i2.p2  ORF type:complete len:102 (+),score=19.13 TRINITY_DN29289_c0_g1_i2:168-473(+)